MIFGKRSLWIAIAILGVVIAAAMAAAGDFVFASALVIVVLIGGWYSLRGDTSY